MVMHVQGTAGPVCHLASPEEVVEIYPSFTFRIYEAQITFYLF